MFRVLKFQGLGFQRGFGVSIGVFCSDFVWVFRVEGFRFSGLQGWVFGVFGFGPLRV